MKTVRGTNKLAFCALCVYYAASFFLGPDAHQLLGYTLLTVCSVVIFSCAAMRDGGRVHIQVRAYFTITISFLVFCILSTLWAEDASQTTYIIRKISASIFAALLISCYYHENSVDDLLKCVMFGGYLVVIVLMRDQGLGAYMTAVLGGYRMYENEYFNANELSVVLGSSLLLNLYYIYREKKIKWWNIFAIPAVIMFIGTGSKTGIIYVVGGALIFVVMSGYIKTNSLKKRLFSLLKIFIGLAALLVLLYYLSGLEAFAMVRRRFEGLFNLLRGSGTVDGSSAARSDMMRVGRKLFLSSPFVGIGMNNPRLHYARSYLHSDLWEMLAGGGIIGFVLYASIYVYTFYNFWKYRAYRMREYNACFALVVMRFLMEYFTVRYYQIDQWFWFFLFFTEIQHLKTQKRMKGINT